MSEGILQRLSEGIVLGDGGYLLELERRGYVQAGPFVPEPSITNPEALAGLHREFVDAGVDVLQTLTFYASEDKLATVGLEGRVDDMNREATRIARRVAGEAERDVLVAGNLSCAWVFGPVDPKTHRRTRELFDRQLDVMTAGHGIAHSEQSPPDHPPGMHGLQLWVALPEDARHGAGGESDADEEDDEGARGRQGLQVYMMCEIPSNVVLGVILFGIEYGPRDLRFAIVEASAGKVDAADYDGSGKQSVVIGNFTNESIALYHNDGSGLFTDEAPASGIGKMSAQSLTFACFFFDYDLDGMLDIFAANGHVSDDISVVQPTVKYAQPPHLFRNRGKKKFEEVTAKLGRALNRAIVGRGAAYGDFDNDGDLDLLVTTNNGPARLLRNENANQNDLLRVKTAGTRANRDGIGAKVVVKTSKGSRVFGMVRTGSSYCSQSELPLTFGLGKPEEGTTLTLEITWPGGQKDTITNVKPNQSIVVQEGKGIATQEPIIFVRTPPAPSPTPTPTPRLLSKF